jgi:hypothetical protein
MQKITNKAKLANASSYISLHLGGPIFMNLAHFVEARTFNKSGPEVS